MVIYDKKTSKIENETQPSLCLQTWLQQNLRISTNHKYRIYMDAFLQPDVLKTWRFVNLTFCKPDVLQTWRFRRFETGRFETWRFETWRFETWRFVGVPIKSAPNTRLLDYCTSAWSQDKKRSYTGANLRFLSFTISKIRPQTSPPLLSLGEYVYGGA